MFISFYISHVKTAERDPDEIWTRGRLWSEITEYMLLFISEERERSRWHKLVN